MRMKKVLLIDYYGICGQDGRAVGHSPKVLQEYSALLGDCYIVSAAASPCLMKEAGEQFHDKYTLRYNIDSDREMSVRKRIQDKIRLFLNINEALKIDGYDIYWFYKTDFFLFFFLCFRRIRRGRKSAKYMAQIYQAGFGQSGLAPVLNWFYRRGMRKFDGITYAQKDMAGLHPNMLYFPDYYYDPDKYRKYRKVEKLDKVVCLGTMNTYKKLQELMEAFRSNGYPLEIKGYFYDKNYYRNLREGLAQNIVLEDKILSEEEYYQTLAGAKYIVLPYDMGLYQSRTSGVLIESLFLGTAAIAPKQLLAENQISGIGYDSLEELKDITFFTENPVSGDPDRIKEFDKNEIAGRLTGFMNSLQDNCS